MNTRDGQQHAMAGGGVLTGTMSRQKDFVAMVDQPSATKLAPPTPNDGVKASSSRIHVVFVVDTTGSMNTYLNALRLALGQVTALLEVLFPSASDVSVLAYEDYGDGKRKFRSVVQGSYGKLHTFCVGLKPGGGMDLAEASKTALNELSKLIGTWKENDAIVVFHYTDAPPHHIRTNPFGPNRPREERALTKIQPTKTYPGFDWCNIARRFRSISERVKLFTIVPHDSPARGCGAAFYALLGELVSLNDMTANEITRVTMAILHQTLGEALQNETAGEERRGFDVVVFKEHKNVMERLMGDSRCCEKTFNELNTDACNEPTIEPTQENTDLCWNKEADVAFEAIPGICLDYSQLRPRFKRDESFRDTVFSVMKRLVVPDNVMALTTNPVFGRLWRLVCSRREDLRLSALVAKMGACTASKALTAHEIGKLKSWLEDSYDNSEEINAAIEESTKECCRFYVLDAFAKDFIPDVNGIRSLARNPSPSALANIQKILSHMMIVEVNNKDGKEDGAAAGALLLPKDDEENLRYLPEAFDDYQVFTMLPHLMQPGSQYSLKPAAMLAILCCKNPNSLFEERARRFLRSIRGKWLPPVERIDRPEIISYEFSALLANCVDNVKSDALTEEEARFFDRLHEIWRYRRGRFQEVELKTAISPTKPMLLPDAKTKCHRCGEWTSDTLVNHKNICGICLWEMESFENRWKRPSKGHEHFVDESESYIVECTTCQVLYAVLGPSDLNVAPKCHYCRAWGRRERSGAPYRRCGCCQGKWCYPPLVEQKLENDESGDFLCPVCTRFTNGNDCPCDHADIPAATATTMTTTTTHKTTVNEIVQQNPMVVTALGFRKKTAKIIFSTNRRATKMYEAVVNERGPLFLPPRSDAIIPPLEYNGKRILGWENLVANIKQTITKATFEDTCRLCFDDFAVEKLSLACGHCSNKCCRDCLSSWYSQNAPGHLFLPSHDMCPFCRQRPKYQILTRYNHAACGIVGFSRRRRHEQQGPLMRLRADWYYGWCRRCWKVAYALDRRCAQGLPTLEGNFICQQCQEKEADPRIVLEGNCKRCPGCKLLTTHMGGCSHMACPNPKCQIHWCWQCGTFKSSDGAKVYDHMRSVHGGYGWV